MALKLSVDLDNATLNDLVHVVEAARAAGLSTTTPLQLEESTLIVSGKPADKPAIPPTVGDDFHDRPVNVDAALKFIAELLGK